ncbi:5-methylcytosine rRNA methyltransferase NSUN4 [Platysternon megacephalum]|uniref:5-methylcytosine rRNA methyltransferase NSUN4 n=1 Tax=Platysternon megacephalum TaxID=55544 RepID=A0A4D9E103_9SAUR|nr:5-methylcytosine rRNA methyltransferase NSUN4 [Platysternon megacephalum]
MQEEKDPKNCPQAGRAVKVNAKLKSCSSLRASKAGRKGFPGRPPKSGGKLGTGSGQCQTHRWGSSDSSHAASPWVELRAQRKRGQTLCDRQLGEGRPPPLRAPGSTSSSLPVPQPPSQSDSAPGSSFLECHTAGQN